MNTPRPDAGSGTLDLRINEAHSARIYDYYLGGKTNYAADREAVDKIAEALPQASTVARENRAFMHRATVTLAERGIRQWLDIGTGIPTRPNLHEVAQAEVPEARVVYVDNDPIVLAYAQALLTSAPEGRTAYVQADVTDPDTIFDSEQLARTLDLTQPVALSLNALLQFVPDDRDAYGLVRRLLEPLPSGSVLAVTHPTVDFEPEVWRRVTEIYVSSGTPCQVRTGEEIGRFFTGLEMLDPGLAVVHRWRPDVRCEQAADLSDPSRTDAEVALWGGVGVKP
jgi:hypothetical protein